MYLDGDDMAKQVTRFFLDTEFNEDGHTIELISIGLIADNGAGFYEVSSEFDENACNPWVKANVLPHIGNSRRIKRSTIRKQLLRFVTEHTRPNTKPEFWAYYADYDWVVLCQLFGPMIKLPKAFPKICMDLKQLAGDKRLTKQSTTEHNAFNDAVWVRDMVMRLL